jgi:hypothetical protein
MAEEAQTQAQRSSMIGSCLRVLDTRGWPADGDTFSGNGEIHDGFATQTGIMLCPVSNDVTNGNMPIAETSRTREPALRLSFPFG